MSQAQTRLFCAYEHSLLEQLVDNGMLGEDFWPPYDQAPSCDNTISKSHIASLTEDR